MIRKVHIVRSQEKQDVHEHLQDEPLRAAALALFLFGVFACGARAPAQNQPATQAAAPVVQAVAPVTLVAEPEAFRNLPNFLPVVWLGLLLLAVFQQ